MTSSPAGLRSVRSYVRRSGRMTPMRREQHAKLYPIYGLEPDATRPPDWKNIFPGLRLTVDIGFGNGESVLHYARADAGAAVVGFEVYRPGLAICLREVAAAGLRNVRIVNGDATALLPAWFEPASLAAARVFFPDPWPKQRHRKRRLVNIAWLKMMQQLLVPGGYVHLATDDEGYALQAARLAGEVKGLRVEHCAAAPPPGLEITRPRTRFEERGLQAGQVAWDLLVRRE